MSPTARSLDLLRQCGFAVAIVERWLPRANVRQDAFGWADLLACHPLRRQLALVQVTTRHNLAARIAKARALPELRTWLAAGGLAWFHGWYQLVGRWQCHQVSIAGEDLETEVQTPAPRRRGRRPTQAGLFGDLEHG
jgi:hypothetical protein